MSAEALPIDLFSGASMDGIDAALADLSPPAPRLTGHYQPSYSGELPDQLISMTQPGKHEIDRSGQADIQSAQTFGNAAQHLMEKPNIPPTASQALRWCRPFTPGYSDTPKSIGWFSILATTPTSPSRQSAHSRVNRATCLPLQVHIRPSYRETSTCMTVQQCSTKHYAKPRTKLAHNPRHIIQTQQLHLGKGAHPYSVT